MRLEAYELVILRRPADATEYDEPTLERIQHEHLAYHAALRDSGDIVVNGPVIDQPDESVRGLSVYRTGSMERAGQLANADPAVRAGRLVAEVMSWWCPPGTMRLPGRSVTVDDQ